MSQTSPRLDLPLIMPAQAQKHVTVNEALLRLDALVQTVVESASVDTQPADPDEGRVWIIPDGASGTDWSGYLPGSLAVFRDGYWAAIPPQGGWRVHVRDTGFDLVHDAAAACWREAAAVETIAAGVSGAASQAIVIEEILSGLDGASATTSVVIPARSVVFCVSVRTRGAISGAASFDCGIAGETSKFGGSLGIAAGASNLGVIGPTAFYSDTPIVLTAKGGAFTGGEVAVAIHAWLPVAPAPG
ncbi:DUF2793 domain-containing protein [Maricaulis maris]|uniref:Uncharacterized protein DUF2793 n=1 Tax=Maricaulis maris TaxID=74318 RepID=A0A495D287_9PROT|nr:DUF2793 domain-containing protein [Maricaulis maris]RKQ95656.1 uncharacterized protein DUF2793 [Maricaulis maris]